MTKLITLKENIELNIVNKIYDFKSPLNIYIPIFKETTFRTNEYIFKNTYFDDFVTSVSGSIKGNKELVINNKKVNAIKIENDFKENVNKKRKSAKINTKEDLINLLNDFNLRDISNKILEIENITHLVLSSIDEEIYSIKEFMRLSHNYQEILDVFDNVLNILNINQGILATKNTNFKSIKNVKSIIGTYPNIRITLVPDKYLISYKQFLCEYLNVEKKETLILTTNEMYYIYNVLKMNKDITEVLITISGNAISKSLVINVRIGTLLEEILKEYIKIVENNYEIYINGYLQGYKTKDISKIIITRDINSIIINKENHENETECINCGACNKICPFNIKVKNCYFEKIKHKKCTGCGLCSYVCPANLKLKDIVWGRNNEK